MAILHQVEPILESAIKILTQVVDVKGMMGVAKPAPPPPTPPVVEEPVEQAAAPDLGS